jgi:hypothetical protein
MTKLPAVRIGYLRKAPASTYKPCEAPGGPIKAMWNKLAKEGLIEITDKKYRRTASGDEAVSTFDEGLSFAAREVILAVRNGTKNISSMTGVNVVIQSELAFIGNSGFSLTRWGNDLLPSIGDVGIFRKSGNLLLNVLMAKALGKK